MTAHRVNILSGVFVAVLIAALAFPFAAERCLIADNTGVACTVIAKLWFNPWP